MLDPRNVEIFVVGRQKLGSEWAGYEQVLRILPTTLGKGAPNGIESSSGIFLLKFICGVYSTQQKRPEESFTLSGGALQSRKSCKSGTEIVH